MDRALYLCTSLGVDSIGLKSPDYNYGWHGVRWKLRELPSFIKAWIALNIYSPPIVLGTPEPIL